MSLKGENILSSKQFNKESLMELFRSVEEMEEIIESGGNDLLKGKILATLFFEPSTRTRFSFESAMLRLGGQVIGNHDMMKTSSLTKQETLKDTGKVVSKMVDVIAMRHPIAGSVAKLAEKSNVPVLNAGDGANDHPTQGLLDLYTIWKEKKEIDGLTIGMIGDLKNGRVPHSQCELLKNFDVKFLFISPDGLNIPEDLIDELKGQNLKVTEDNDLDAWIHEMDVISMTRIQEERFESKGEYQKYAGSYILDENIMKKAKSDAIILHPLPRVNEISEDLDKDSRAKYFDQVRNGVALRMALLKAVILG